MKERLFQLELSDKELNYLDGALRSVITEREFDVFRFGKGHGNIAHLLWFAKRLQRKLQRIHYPPRGVPKCTPEIRAIIRKAKRRMR